MAVTDYIEGMLLPDTGVYLYVVAAVSSLFPQLHADTRLNPVFTGAAPVYNNDRISQKSRNAITIGLPCSIFY